jgi:toxin ParE1/3/4
VTPVWSPEAINDLVSLRDHISKDSPASAQRIALHIIHNVETLLPDNPQMGRAGRVSGTRELVIPNTPFIVPYRIHDGTLQILRIFHAAGNGPSSSEERASSRRWRRASAGSSGAHRWS